MIKEGIPEHIAKRIWNIKILHLICTHKDDIRKIHIADLRNKYENRGLDLFEMRAVWYNLPQWDPTNPIETSKAEWKESFKSKLDDMAYKDSKNMLLDDERRHSVYKGYENLSIYDPNLILKTKFVYSASMNLNHEFDENAQSNNLKNNFDKLDKLIKLSPNNKSNSNVDRNIVDVNVYNDYDSPIVNDSDDEERDSVDTITKAIHAVRKQFSISDNTPNSKQLVSESKDNTLTPMTLMLKSLQQYNRQDHSDPITSDEEDDDDDDFFGGEVVVPIDNIHSDIVNCTEDDTYSDIHDQSKEDIHITVIDLIKKGDANKFRQICQMSAIEPLDVIVSTELLHYCCIHVSDLIDPVGTFAYLLYACKANGIL
eukprot:gene17823-23434_t